MHAKGIVGKAGLVLATAVVTTTLAGTSVASAFNVPGNSVDSSKIVNESIRSVDIRNGAVRTADVADGNLTGTDVAEGSLNGTDVSDNTLTANDIAPSGVGTSELATGAVTTSDIADATITPTDLAVSAQTRWAKVDAGVTTALLNGRGATTATRLGVGQYKVTFSSSILNCGWTATINDNDAGGATGGFATVERDLPGDAFSLRVRTFDASGAQADTADNDGFTLTVVC